MKKEEFILKSDCDGLPLSVMMFTPQTEIKGIVQISHGMSEHKERYIPFMEFLTHHGYVMVIHDHRGHGKSVKGEDDLGFFYDHDANYIVNDVHQITLYIKEKYPQKPFILFGHSMGSMVVRKYIKTYDQDIDKLIVCGSPSKNPQINFALIFTKFLQKIKGETYRSPLIQKLAFGSYNKKLSDVTSENAWICANEETVKAYDRDALCGFVFTTNGFENLFHLMKDIYDKDGWSLNHKDLPIFFIAGSDDPVIISKEKWIESQNFLKQLGYTNVTSKLYDGLRHEILNEQNKDEIMTDILKFINS